MLPRSYCSQWIYCEPAISLAVKALKADEDMQAYVICKNEEANIERCVESLAEADFDF